MYGSADMPYGHPAGRPISALLASKKSEPVRLKPILRKVMLSGGDRYRRVVSGSLDCRKADEAIAGTIANVRAATR